MHIHEVHDLFQLQLCANGRSPNTAAQYARHIRLFESWLTTNGRSTEIERMDHVAVAQFLTSDVVREKRGGGLRKGTSTNGIRGSLRSFFLWARDAGYAQRNAAALVKRERCGTLRPRSLNQDEQRRLLHVLSIGDDLATKRDRALVLVLLRCGLRIGSALSLDIEDLDVDRAEFVVRTAKNGQPDRFPIGQSLREGLARLVENRTRGPVFVGTGGHRITIRHASRRFRMWLERARITSRVTLHSLRHTYAEAVLDRTGGNIRAVKEALGHKSIVSSLIYLEGRRDAVRRAAME